MSEFLWYKEIKYKETLYFDIGNDLVYISGSIYCLFSFKQNQCLLKTKKKKILEIKKVIRF